MKESGLCGSVGTRAVPCIGWTEQLRRREHFASAPCNIKFAYSFKYPNSEGNPRNVNPDGFVAVSVGEPINTNQIKSTPTAGHRSNSTHDQGTAAQGAVPFLRPYLRQNFHTWKDREAAAMHVGRR
jgi:hypothetical protein